MSWLKWLATEWGIPLIVGLPLAGVFIYLDANGHHTALTALIVAGTSAFGAFLGFTVADDEETGRWAGWDVLFGAVLFPWILTLFYVVPTPLPDAPHLVDSLIRISWTLAITMMGAWVIKQPRSRWVHLLFVGLGAAAMGFIWLQDIPRLVSGGVFCVLFAIPALVQMIRPDTLDTQTV